MFFVIKNIPLQYILLFMTKVTFCNFFPYLCTKVRLWDEVGIGGKFKQNTLFSFMIYINIYHLFLLYFLIYCNKHPPVQALKITENISGEFNLAPTTFSHIDVVLRMKWSIIMFEFEMHWHLAERPMANFLNTLNIIFLTIG